MRLIDGVNRNLPTFHRYLKLRQRMMKLPELHYYDLYAPLVGVGGSDLHADEAREARARGAGAARPGVRGGREAGVHRALDRPLSRTTASASGAYSNGGAYDVHPYMLLNYNGKYTDVSTLAHELGHTMHSYFSNKTQPFATAGYPIFVAEVASTFNEALLIENMLQDRSPIPRPGCRCSATTSRTSRGPCSARRSSPSSSCACTRWSEKGQPLTGEALDKLYADDHQEVLRPRQGRLRRGRLRRARVGVHPALLPQLLRVPVRDLVHRVVGAVREGAWPAIRRRPSGT